MIRYRRNKVERDVAWLIIWVIFVAMMVRISASPTIPPMAQPARASASAINRIKMPYH